MKTYSDTLNPIRIFLGDRNPTNLERTALPDGSQIERWLIDGIEIILHINPEGEWQVYVPVSRSVKEPTERIADLERYLMGERPDLTIMADMANLCERFLDKLAEFPACSDLGCGQAACAEARATRQAIVNFRVRLFAAATKEKKNVAP